MSRLSFVHFDIHLQFLVIHRNVTIIRDARLEENMATSVTIIRDAELEVKIFFLYLLHTHIFKTRHMCTVACTSIGECHDY